ncbi:MAG: hypothetical protein ACXV5Q_10000 [Frankiaceae bacterium]
MGRSKDQREEAVALAGGAAGAERRVPWVVPMADRVDTPLEVTMYVARRR